MEKRIQDELIKLLKDELKPAIGCTEPVAVAFAAAKAYKEIGGKLEEVYVAVSPSFIKAKLAVIPGTTDSGFDLASVLAVIVGDSDLEMQVLKNVDDDSVVKTKEWLSTHISSVVMKEGSSGVYVEVELKTDKGVSKIIIKDNHTNIVLLEVNGENKTEKPIDKEETKRFNLTDLKIADLIEFVEEVSFDDIKFVLDGAEMNLELARDGLENEFGLGIGSSLAGMAKDKKLGDDPAGYAQILVAAAGDARFGGSRKPAMSVAGSGSHGITAMLTLVAIAEKMGIGEEKLARALALTDLITLYIKLFTGRLSAFCGCAVTAATAASAGIVYMLGGNSEQIGNAIKNMFANLTGVICDGGNISCILKTSTGAATAIREAFFALQGIVIPEGNGIVAGNVEDTIKNVGRISFPGMVETDKIIVDIMNK